MRCFGTGQDSVAIPSVNTVYPHANARGVYAAATYSSTGGVPALLLPGANAMAFREPSDPAAPPPPKVVGGWAGSLINDQVTSTGLNFRRNRFVDPGTGRFTTVDPIGLRGGLGVYVYAGGDPINLFDPIGTCPRITANGNNVLIEANLIMVGLPDKVQKSIVDGIKRIWQGRVGDYKVELEIDDSSAPQIDVFYSTRRRGNVAGEGGSHFDGIGGDMAVYGRWDIGPTAAHEFGHVMRLDHNPSSTSDIMFPSLQNTSQRATGDQIKDALQRCGPFA